MHRAHGIMASWWTTALLACAIAGLYVFYAFGEAPYAVWMNTLFQSTTWRLVYAALVVDLILKSALLLMSRFAPITPTMDSVRSMQEHAELPASSWDRMEGWFKEHGMSPVIQGDTVVARRGESSVIAGAVLRLGIVLVMAALPFSMSLRTVQETRLVQSGPAETVFDRSVKADSVEADLPESFIQIGDKSIFKLEELAASVAVDGATHEITAGYPSKIGGLYWRVSDFGYAATLTIDGKPTGLMLDVLPPGRQDVRQIGGQTLRLSLAPEREIKKGLVTGLAYNLQSPSIKAELKAADGSYNDAVTLKPGASILLGGAHASITPSALFVKVSAVRDPALAILIAGVWTSLLGLALMFCRLFWYERRMCAVRCADGVLLGYSEEFYSKWAIHKFRRWIEESGTAL